MNSDTVGLLWISTSTYNKHNLPSLQLPRCVTGYQKPISMQRVVYKLNGQNIQAQLKIQDGHSDFCRLWYYVDCAGNKIEKYETGGAYSAVEGGERRVKSFGGKTWGKETTGETQA
jgi:hypothetical protein